MTRREFFAGVCAGLVVAFSTLRLRRPRTFIVTTVDELRTAAREANASDTVWIKAGTYDLAGVDDVLPWPLPAMKVLPATAPIPKPGIWNNVGIANGNFDARLQRG